MEHVVETYVPEKKGLHWVMVYGTLKRGFYNHYLLSGDTTSSPGILQSRHVQTKDELVMVVDDRGIPYLMESLSSDQGKAYKIQGELYQVDDGLLKELDILEGTPSYYCRKTIPIEKVENFAHDVAPMPPNGCAFVYVKSEVTNPEENAKLRTQERYSSYTMSMHATYVPPPLRAPENWRPQLDQVCSAYERIASVKPAQVDARNRSEINPVEKGLLIAACELAAVESTAHVIDIGTGIFSPCMQVLVNQLNAQSTYAWGIDCIDIKENFKERFQDIQSRYSQLNIVDLYQHTPSDMFESIDVVCMIRVLEHIPAILHRHVLLTLYRLLKIEGRLVVSFPAALKDIVEADLTTEQLFYETPSTQVEALLEECGFEIISKAESQYEDFCNLSNLFLLSKKR